MASIETLHPFVLETERLKLRHFAPDDATHFYMLNQDPEVLRYTGDKPFETVESARDFLVNYDQYKKYGIGRWAVIARSDAQFLGWCGLKYQTATDEYDLGFRFFRSHWNKGYATEAAAASIDAGFERFGLQVIIGRAMIQNTASIKVLQKVGMQYHKTDLCHGAEAVIYRIEKAAP